MRHRIVVIFLSAFVAFSFFIPFARAADAPVKVRSAEAQAAYVPDKFFRAIVVDVTGEGVHEEDGQRIPYQDVWIRLLSGPEQGKMIRIDYTGDFELDPSQKVKKGETIIVVETAAFNGKIQYYIADKYRLPSLVIIFAVFFALVILFGRRRGVTSVLGLVVSILVLALYVVPQIAAGKNPLVASVVGAFVICLVSLYLAHGFNKRTTIALGGTMITLGISVGLTFSFVSFAKLFGMGDENAFYLQSGSLATLNLRGLLMGGIIIGVLGVLDDITTAQSAAVEEIHRANKTLDVRELYHRGLSVGREHITSLVNTLALAYAGASLPLFLLFATASTQPIWVTLNSQLIAEEFIRTLVGSTSLVLAVPITTILAAWFYGRTRS